MSKKIAVIIGAGPAGLTAAYELLEKTDIKPIIFEKTGDIGGISKTVNYKGNRIDIGGHRFFSKSDIVMNWWQKILPLQSGPSKDDKLLKRELPIEKKEELDPDKVDRVMLIRGRVSRILYLRKFFNYPVSLSLNTIRNLGVFRIGKIGLSYLKVKISPVRNEETLEDFFINRFGKELYLTFFKDYTEKLWGVSCDNISAQWGAQRIKGLSVTKALLHAFKNIITKDSSFGQKKTETSLIGQFFYPKFGPGQMWKTVAEAIKEKGGVINLNYNVDYLKVKKNEITEIMAKNSITGEEIDQKADYFFSTMPVKHLVKSLGEGVPSEVKEVADGLIYRDFITVGLLLNKINLKNQTKIKTINDIIPDNWIYVQEPDVKMCRIQVFNNWSPYLLKDDKKIWIGLEYVLGKKDDLWTMSNEDIKDFGINELVNLDIIKKEYVDDSVVIKMEKTYPAYFGAYKDFKIIRSYIDNFKNLFLIGRNGMHRYNNMDHSMLSAMEAVNNIINKTETKDNIWSVNAEEEYHEEKNG